VALSPVACPPGLWGCATVTLEDRRDLPTARGSMETNTLNFLMTKLFDLTPSLLISRFRTDDGSVKG
jgi:hypothetical protein